MRDNGTDGTANSGGYYEIAVPALGPEKQGQAVGSSKNRKQLLLGKAFDLCRTEKGGRPTVWGGLLFDERYFAQPCNGVNQIL